MARLLECTSLHRRLGGSLRRPAERPRCAILPVRRVFIDQVSLYIFLCRRSVSSATSTDRTDPVQGSEQPASRPPARRCTALRPRPPSILLAQPSLQRTILCHLLHTSICMHSPCCVPFVSVLVANANAAQRWARLYSLGFRTNCAISVPLLLLYLSVLLVVQFSV